MPFYTPKFEVTDFSGGKGILASDHLQYLEAGATLDATAFPTGDIGAGKLIARNTSTGKFEPVADITGDEEEGTTGLEGFDEFSVLEYGFTNDGKNDLIAGSVIVRGSVYEAKLADEVSNEFKALTPMIRYVSHK
ncbi:hypothetical protein JOC34_002824 [Virgibacillus halotolerans]|uniref:hypothetical protein n=1 Tax=Virgibacillus halotolerans TaxID=1071053 RepID=UPI001961F92A|nr:hypothetical protein [Virgibacillus halotolerans]MBM7600433.1 hypothetical protein [Virgibacillus halotolerans]